MKASGKIYSKFRYNKTRPENETQLKRRTFHDFHVA